MSVINDMLSNLDERRAQTPEAPGTAAAGVVEAVPRAARRRLGLMALGGATLVSAAAFAQWPALMGDPVAGPQPVVIPQVVATVVTPDAMPLVPVDPVAAVAPVQVAAVEARPVSALTPQTRRGKAAPAANADSSGMQAPHPTPSPARRGLEAAPTTAAMALPMATVAMASPTTPVTDTPRGNGTVEKRVLPPSAAQRATVAYQQAIDLAASGHSTPAIARALEALAADPDHIAARELAAVLMMEGKRLADAAALMRDGLARQPQQRHLVMLLARIEAETGATQAALDRLSAAPGLDGEGHGLRAALLARAERYREAASAYEAAVRLQPDNASWWFGLGVALDADGQAPLARQALQRARAIGSLRGDALAYVEQKLSQ